MSRRGESSAFLLNPRLVKSTSFIKEAGSTVATLRTGAPYYLLIEKARARHMAHMRVRAHWPRALARMDNYKCDLRALKEPSAPRPLRRGAGSLASIIRDRQLRSFYLLIYRTENAERVYVVGVRTASANSTIFIYLSFFTTPCPRAKLGRKVVLLHLHLHYTCDRGERTGH